MFINIYSKGKYPANMLSNFAPHEFDFDGYKRIPCMESFLQSLKFQDVVVNAVFCTWQQKRPKHMVAQEVGIDTYTGRKRRLIDSLETTFA